jgi:hypothetical protein
MIIGWTHTGDYDVYKIDIYADATNCEVIRQTMLCRAPLDHPYIGKKYKCDLACFPERVEKLSLIDLSEGEL